MNKVWVLWYCGEKKSKGSYLKLLQVLSCWNVWINCYRIGKLCIKRSFRCTCVKIYTPTGKEAFEDKYLFWLRIRHLMKVQILAKHLTNELEDDTFLCVYVSLSLFVCRTIAVYSMCSMEIFQTWDDLSTMYLFIYSVS